MALKIQLMYHRIIFNLTMPLALSTTLLAGCSKPASVEPVQKYSLVGHSVQFAPPPAKFELKQEKAAPQLVGPAYAVDDKNDKVVVSTATPSADKSKGKVVALIFETIDKEAHIAVHGVDGINFDKLTKENLQPFADAIYKRDGRFNQQTEVDMLGGKGNGYRMGFEWGSGETKMRGVQIHVPYNKVLYSIIMTAPAKEFEEDLPYYETVVKTFQVL